MSRKKANVRPDLVGELFTDGKDYYILNDCASEPSATFKDITTETLTTKPISEFANFVQLKPVRPIEKPKKPRADLGKTHKKQASKPSEAPAKKSKAKTKIGAEGEPEIADKKGDNLTIHVPTGMEGDTDYIVNIAGSEACGSVGLRQTVLAALEEWGGRIPDELTEQERQTIQGILEAGDTP